MRMEIAIDENALFFCEPRERYASSQGKEAIMAINRTMALIRSGIDAFAKFWGRQYAADRRIEEFSPSDVLKAEIRPANDIDISQTKPDV